MTLKDWKLHKKNYWINKKIEESITLRPLTKKIYINDFGPVPTRFILPFKTKQQANNIIKNYMKENN